MDDDAPSMSLRQRDDAVVLRLTDLCDFMILLFFNSAGQRTEGS
jgi:hypothetical protein